MGKETGEWGFIQADLTMYSRKPRTIKRIRDTIERQEKKKKPDTNAFLFSQKAISEKRWLIAEDTSASSLIQKAKCVPHLNIYLHKF